MSDRELKPASPITGPLPMSGWPRWVVYFLSLLGIVYILNPTLGIYEIIPDIVPFIGNLDEGVAMWLLFSGLIELFGGRKAKKRIATLAEEDDGPAGLLSEGTTVTSDQPEDRSP